MMNFTCTYCEKPINGVALILDKTHFLHQGCEEAFKKNKNCYCGKPIDTSNPDCVDYQLCEEHADDV